MPFANVLAVASLPVLKRLGRGRGAGRGRLLCSLRAHQQFRGCGGGRVWLFYAQICDFWIQRAIRSHWVQRLVGE